MCPDGAPAGGDGHELTLGAFTCTTDSLDEPRDNGVGSEDMAGIGIYEQPKQLLDLSIQLRRAHRRAAEPSGADGLTVQEQALELVAHTTSDTSPACSAA